MVAFMSVAEIVTTEAPPLPWADDNLTTAEEHKEHGKEVRKPDPAHIPTGKMFKLYQTYAHTARFGTTSLNFILEVGESEVLEMFVKYMIKTSLLINSSKQFSDCRVSAMEQLRDDEGNLMLFYVQKKLDAIGTSNRKTWRSVGQVLQVSSDHLDLIETDYIARKSPTESLLELLKNRAKEPTMKEFAQALITCGRHDVAEVICNWPWAKYFVPVRSESPCDMVQ